MTDRYADLIARLEQASEGSRELDGIVWCIKHDREFHSWDGAGVVYKDETGIRHCASEYVQFYTTSLDAVLTLVPEGAQYCLGCLSDTRVSVRGVSRYHAWACKLDTVYAPTPALALCIAALRARAAMESQS